MEIGCGGVSDDGWFMGVGLWLFGGFYTLFSGFTCAMVLTCIDDRHRTTR